jgi:hypothetical protein
VKFAIPPVSRAALVSLFPGAPSFLRKQESLPRQAVIPAKAGISLLLQQIPHIRIRRPDHVDLPLPLPSFNLGFPIDCFPNV